MRQVPRRPDLNPRNVVAGVDPALDRAGELERRAGQPFQELHELGAEDPEWRRGVRVGRIVIDDSTVVVRGAGDVVARRSLEFYDALGRVMAVKGNA